MFNYLQSNGVYIYIYTFITDQSFIQAGFRSIDAVSYNPQ